MGRALLITLAAILVALSYTFFNMNGQGKSMTKRNINTYSGLRAKNYAHTGIQLAIEEYNSRKADNNANNDEFSDYAVTVEQADLTLSLVESTESINGNSTEVITVTSHANYRDSEHEVEATFDVSENQSLVPEFISAISVANGNVNFYMPNNSSEVNGIDNTGDCQMDAPGVTMPTQNDVTDVQNTEGYKDGRLRGNPPVKLDTSIDFSELSELIDILYEQPNTQKLTGGKWNGDLGSADDPGIFIVEEPTKIQSNGTGYGILVVRQGAELEVETTLDVRGTFEFNGLILFENTYDLGTNGDFNINGSMIFGVEEGNNTAQDISLSGNVFFQFDCDAEKYANGAVNNTLNTTLYQMLSIYE